MGCPPGLENGRRNSSPGGSRPAAAWGISHRPRNDCRAPRRYHMVRFLRVFALSLYAVFAAAASAQAPTKLEVIVFAGGVNWPIWVGQENGYFRDNGVEVNVTPTPGSVYQMVNLIDGKLDIAMTAIDNLIAYREGQGEDPKPGPDLIAVMGADQGFLKLVSVPEVSSIGDLRG